MKNKYLVENNEIEFRRASISDNLEDIAKLIYKTDPYIYPFWFNNNINDAVNYLPKLIAKPNNLFNFDNLYVAYDKTTNHIVGILCAIDRSLTFNNDYSEDKKINHNYEFTIDKYIIPIEKEVETFDDSTIYISNICIDENLRSKGIGSYLLGYFISQMEKQGYDKFELDCLLHNLRAKNLYHGMGFKEMKEIVGFDGTDHSTVEVVSFLRKKGAYYPDEFQVK